MSYAKAIEWLFSTQMFGIKLGLEGVKDLLSQYLAHPPHDCQVIHVAGTNGKGSTCAMIDRIARSCGKRTGLFTSPHLIDFRERIQVSGIEIPEKAAAAMLSELRILCEKMPHHPTFFEITLALAMRWFNQSECELIILETGMGGRLDATTAVPADVCVLTPIGLDHTEWLGSTIEEIATEKAGIFISGKPAVSSPQVLGARQTLEQLANANRTPLSWIQEPLCGYTINLDGEHQQWNAALAIEALHLAQLPLNADIIRDGLARLSWPGRFERIEEGLILDGAHNPHAAHVLVQTWQQAFPKTKACLIFSAVSSKDVSGIITPLADIAEEILLCPTDSPRALSAHELATFLPNSAPPHLCLNSLHEALKLARTRNAPILIAGSLFLIGEARALLTGSTFLRSAQ